MEFIGPPPNRNYFIKYYPNVYGVDYSDLRIFALCTPNQLLHAYITPY